MPEYTGFERKKLVLDGASSALPKAPFVELGLASPFSFLRGASDAIELVLTALELGMDAIGIADRNTLAGVVRLHSAAKGAGLTPLIGCRLELAPLPPEREGSTREASGGGPVTSADARPSPPRCALFPPAPAGGGKSRCSPTR